MNKRRNPNRPRDCYRRERLLEEEWFLQCHPQQNAERRARLTKLEMRLAECISAAG